MADPKKAILRFTPSGSPDVVGYNLYYEPENLVLSHQSPKVYIDNPPINANGQVEIDISTLAFEESIDGHYNLGIASVDDAGNESALLTEGLEDVALDFVAPDPPTNASIIYV
jgi:hypothetical protein